VTYYTGGDAADVFDADKPVHAGAVRKLLQDNLKCCDELSANDYQAYFWDDDEIYDTPSANDEWTYYDMQGLWLPVYPKLGGGWRSMTFSTEARVTGGTATIRLCLLPAYTVPTVDTSDCIPSCTTYADKDTASTTYTVIEWDAITPDESCICWKSCDSVAPGVSMPGTYVRLFHKNTDASKNTYLRGLRVKEGT